MTHEGRTGAKWTRAVEWAKANRPWVCIRCGKPIDRDRKHPDPQSVSVDHFPTPARDLPPDHPLQTDPANLQLAHLGCNSRAGNQERRPRPQSRAW